MFPLSAVAPRFLNADQTYLLLLFQSIDPNDNPNFVKPMLLAVPYLILFTDCSTLSHQGGQ